MNILIIYAHPSNKSFTYKVLHTLLKDLNMGNHQVEVSDVMLDDRLGVRFEKKEMIILGGTLELEKVANSHFEKIMNLGMAFKS